jgi:hypothetical protein
MMHSKKIRFPFPRFLFSGFSAFGLACGLFLSACEMGGFSEDGAKPVDTTTTPAGYASLRISNKVSVDPSTLTFYLYSSTAVDYSNAVNAKKIGEVKSDSTKSFQVPVGKWKIASQNKAGVLEPMEDEASGGGEWLQSVFAKDQVYTLILGSNAGRMVWTPSYTTIPAMSSL